MEGLWVLWRVVGRRAGWSFGGVVALVVGLLSAIHVTSRNALRQYVEDQLSRVPWDMTVYQLTELDYATRVREAIRSLEDVRQVENLYFLRASLPPTSVPEVDHKALRTPWLALLTATDPSLLPREVRPQSGLPAARRPTARGALRLKAPESWRRGGVETKWEDEVLAGLENGSGEVWL